MSPLAIVLLAAWVAALILVLALCRVAGQSDIALHAKEPTVPYPPVREQPHPTPVLDASLALAGALVVVLVAASAHRVGWMILGGLVAVVALLVIAWEEQR